MPMEADKNVDRIFAEKILGWTEYGDGWSNPQGVKYGDIPPFTDSYVVLVCGGDETYLCGIKIPALGPLVKELSSRRGDVLCHALLKPIDLSPSLTDEE